MPVVKVASYNIHRCFGMDRRYSPERVCDVIKHIDADVIGLQEVDVSLKVADGRDQLQFLADETGMRALIGPTVVRATGHYGNAFLSRVPLKNIVEKSLAYRRFEPRGLIAGDLETGEIRIRVVNTHLGLGWIERKFQTRNLLDSLELTQDIPTVLMGDFNEWFPYSGNLKRLHSVFGQTQFKPSFPAAWPKLCLDRIWVSPARCCHSTRTIDTSLTKSASDHLPVVMTVEVQ